MSRPKKNLPSENPESSNFSNEVEEQIETQGDGSFETLIKNASASLNQPQAQKGKSRTTQWRESKRAKSGAQAEEVTTFVITVMTLLLSAVQMPPDLKPNDDEIGAFSVPATKLLMRHVNLTGKLTQDALDVIGMVAAISAYGVRTGAAWKNYRAAKDAEKAALDSGMANAPVEGAPL